VGAIAGVIQGGDPVQMAANVAGVTVAGTAAYSAQTVVNSLQRTSRNVENGAE
jgi:hypothetical protein